MKKQTTLTLHFSDDGRVWTEVNGIPVAAEATGRIVQALTHARMFDVLKRAAQAEIDPKLTHLVSEDLTPVCK